MASYTQFLIYRSRNRINCFSLIQCPLCCDKRTTFFSCLYDEHHIRKSTYDSVPCRKKIISCSHTRRLFTYDSSSFPQDTFIQGFISRRITDIHTTCKNCVGCCSSLQCSLVCFCINPVGHAADDLHSCAAEDLCISKCLDSSVCAARPCSNDCYTWFFPVGQSSFYKKYFRHFGVII